MSETMLVGRETLATKLVGRSPDRSLRRPDADVHRPQLHRPLVGCPGSGPPVTAFADDIPVVCGHH
ncbi:hypothetical protein [Streptomyces xantholiticus]|uniref:hypothetical protein n=1 Tax=Streptomyces xantholiticus TaxID=68285 RepID=UPI0016745932|nr:hypothetical protein [Streptomyces xantholiticus]